MSPTIPNSLHVLRCPLTGRLLKLLSSAQIVRINSDIRLGLRRHADSMMPPAPLIEGLGTLEVDIIYRIDDDIVCLLPQMAILLLATAVDDSGLSPESKIVQSFYNEFGWVKNSSGRFNDTSAFTETRLCARRYQIRCNERILALLGRGEFLLDVASGAIPHPEYCDHSRHYRTRICVDFSIRALREARTQIGDHGLFVLGNITRLPLAADAIDAVISLHTLYHLPPDEQPAACDELVRVARPRAPVLVVYVWRDSPLMNVIESVRLLPRHARRWWHRLRRRPAGPPITRDNQASTAPALYFNPCDYPWFRSHIASRHRVSLRVWSAVSCEFQTRFFTETPSGRCIAQIVSWFENHFPAYAGRNGQYPIWIFSKSEPTGTPLTVDLPFSDHPSD